jgi:hypothetical protein
VDLVVGKPMALESLREAVAKAAGVSA